MQPIEPLAGLRPMRGGRLSRPGAAALCVATALGMSSACGRIRGSEAASGTGDEAGSSGPADPKPADGDGGADDGPGTKFDLDVRETGGTDCPPDHESDCSDDTGGPSVPDPPEVECSCPAVWQPQGDDVVGNSYTIDLVGPPRGTLRAAASLDETGIVFLDDTTLKFQRLDENAQPIETVALPFQVGDLEAFGLHNMVAPSMVWTGSGYAIGYWGDQGAMVGVIDNNGDVVAGPIPVSDDGDGYNPVLVRSGDVLHTVWIGSVAGEVFVRQWAGDLTPITEAAPVSENASASTGTLGVTVVGDRLGIVYVWRDPSPNDHPRVALVGEDDEVQTVDFGAEPVHAQAKTAIASQGDAAVVCWMYQTYPEPYDVRCRFMAADGELLGDTKTINPSTHLVAGSFDVIRGACDDFLLLLHGSMPYTGDYEWWLARGQAASGQWERLDLPFDTLSYNVTLVPAAEGLRALTSERIPATATYLNHAFALGC